MKFSLLLDSPVPIYSMAGRLYTLDLWAHDLEVTKLFYEKVGVISDIFLVEKLSMPGCTDLPSGVRIFPRSIQTLEAIDGYDLIQLNGNNRFSSSIFSALLFFGAKVKKRKIILGISSNRAKTHLMNSNKSFLQRTKGILQYINIRMYQIIFGYAVNGAFVVGDGLVKLLPRQQKNVHVSYASWIRKEDIRSPSETNSNPSCFKFAIASRLEKMKGVDLGLLALSAVRNLGHNRFSVEIAGIGPELNNLEDSIKLLNLADNIKFIGALPYDKFHKWMSEFHYVLCTNLNNEQPRIIFDALQAGCLPIYPLIDSYISIGLPKELGYIQGDQNDLARVIIDAIHHRHEYCTSGIYQSTINLLQSFTLDEMHRKRAFWIESKIMSYGR